MPTLSARLLLAIPLLALLAGCTISGPAVHIRPPIAIGVELEGGHHHHKHHRGHHHDD